ncbi:hypothetical protein XBO1_1100010 [Xenorhabdus bovienii str. oregonense]|uniref:Uncharacterized protein n=2 Tax=Xenorhabdus bovienii TaxID=40576 RepID=A0A077QM68_XENBV|nr:hypothetical protein XBO1_1100010 [Xenorhabdus bovienii str. oregonense]CDH34435.1 hypothetical protein XBI1_3080009 [Xenorhabdus bovienii str. Intermedium]
MIFSHLELPKISNNYYGRKLSKMLLKYTPSGFNLISNTQRFLS